MTISQYVYNKQVALTHRFNFSYSSTGAPSGFVFKNYTLRAQKILSLIPTCPTLQEGREFELCFAVVILFCFFFVCLFVFLSLKLTRLPPLPTALSFFLSLLLDYKISAPDAFSLSLASILRQV